MLDGGSGWGQAGRGGLRVTGLAAGGFLLAEVQRGPRRCVFVLFFESQRLLCSPLQHQSVNGVQHDGARARQASSQHFAFREEINKSTIIGLWLPILSSYLILSYFGSGSRGKNEILPELQTNDIGV